MNSSVTDTPEMKFRCFGNSETQRKLEFSSLHHFSEIRKLEFLSQANWKFRCVPRICFVVKEALSSLPLSSSRVQLFFSLTRPCASVTVLSLWHRYIWPWYYSGENPDWLRQSSSTLSAWTKMRPEGTALCNYAL